MPKLWSPTISSPVGFATAAVVGAVVETVDAIEVVAWAVVAGAVVGCVLVVVAGAAQAARREISNRVRTRVKIRLFSLDIFTLLTTCSTLQRFSFVMLLNNK